MSVHEDLKKLLRLSPGQTQSGYCCACDKQTEQILELLDPDNPDGFLIWQCCECGENIEVQG